jgi:hypothetical protein
MEKPESTKVFLMLVGLVLQVLACSTPAKTTAPQAIAPYAGDIVETDRIKTLLLRPEGWIGTWEGLGIAGFFDIVFADNAKSRHT